MTKIAVTGAGAVLGQGIIKALKAAPAPYEIVALDPNPLSPGLYWGDSSGIIPLAKDGDYCSEIEAMLVRERPDAVLVGTDVELDIFARKRLEWERKFDTNIVVSPPKIIEIADDKLATVRWLQENGLPYPRSAAGDAREEVEALVSDIGFPLIVKPRRGARAVGVSLVRDRDELEAALREREGLLVQQWAGPDNEEYTAGVVCFDERIAASIVLRRDLRDGNTHRAYSDDYPDCDAFVRRVAAALQPYGPANFQFRRGPDGEFRLFEINARFSGTTPMRALLGFNEVHMVLQRVLNGTTVTQPQIAKGTVVRFLEEQVLPGEIAQRDGVAA